MLFEVNCLIEIIFKNCSRNDTKNANKKIELEFDRIQKKSPQ